MRQAIGYETPEQKIADVLDGFGLVVIADHTHAVNDQGRFEVLVSATFLQRTHDGRCLDQAVVTQTQGTCWQAGIAQALEEMRIATRELSQQLFGRGDGLGLGSAGGADGEQSNAEKKRAEY
ncbi:hypothetical protein [Pseudomonas sp. H3(2019)]|uniref:hypothetical protein n=1 Tax=Pseudomonas sp. H3(2019) TaxID=2598724 RepID=UPI0021159033|nr:hypothetical protein [Pseudomonas sp. H3(2019)]